MKGDRVLADGQEELLRCIVTETSAEMLRSCGLAATSVDPSPALSCSEHHIAGFVGFSGKLRGSLVLAASSTLFRDAYPLARESLTSPSSADLLDWAGEMANQTVGRIKRRFCQRGADFDASTPTAVTGRQLGGRSQSRYGAIDLAFAVGNEILSVYFEIEVPSDGTIFKPSADPIPCSLEGDLILF